jgi:hypothetical protein
MAIVPATSNSYTGDGTTTLYSLSFPYLKEADVFVSVNDINTAFTFSTPSVVSITPAPANGAAITIYRSTSANTVQYNFSEGVPFLTRFADINWKQLLYALQEAVNNTATALLGYLRSVRTPESIPALPNAAGRALKLLWFDALGYPVVVTLNAIGIYLPFTNVAAMAAANYLPIGAQVRTQYFSTIGDGGEGVFDIVAASGTPNGHSRVLLANGNHAVLRAINGVYNTAQFGGDIVSAITAVKGNKQTLKIIKTVNVAAGTQIIIDLPITIIGDGINSSKLVFSGSPTKAVRTYRVWKAEYDVGDYSSSADAAIGAAFILTPNAVGSVFRDFEIEAYWDSTINYPLPFNSATSYPTSNYDFGMLIQASNIEISRVRTSGPWGTGGVTGGIALDLTQPNGAVEHVKINDCELYGCYGNLIIGPQGAGAGPNYTEMPLADVRGAGGLSDYTVIGTQIYDTQLRLRIDGVNKRVKRYAFGSGGGSLYINGQISRNSSKRQQHVRFIACRFVNIDDYTLNLNYINRVEFIACHTEFRGGSYLQDGVTDNGAAYMYGRSISENARNILFIGGDRSGEPDNIAWRSGDIQIVNEIGIVDGVVSVNNRTHSGGVTRARKSWTPSVKIGGVALTTGITIAFGTIDKDKGRVHGTFRIDVNSNQGLTGAVTIEDLPYKISEKFSTSSSDSSVVIHTLSNVDFGNQLGGNIDEGTTVIQLIRNISGSASGNLTSTHVVPTWSIRGSFTYTTDDPDII